MKNVELTAIINRLVKDYNEFSLFVAMYHDEMEQGEGEEEVLQWNLGRKDQVEEYLTELAGMSGVKLQFQCDSHSFGYGDRQQTLDYPTVRIAEIEPT